MKENKIFDFTDKFEFREAILLLLDNEFLRESASNYLNNEDV